MTLAALAPDGANKSPDFPWLLSEIKDTPSISMEKFRDCLKVFADGMDDIFEVSRGLLKRDAGEITSGILGLTRQYLHASAEDPSMLAEISADPEFGMDMDGGMDMAPRPR